MPTIPKTRIGGFSCHPELRHPGVLCYLLSLLKRLGKLVVQVDELLHGYDLPAPAQEQEGWTTPVFTAVSIF